MIITENVVGFMLINIVIYGLLLSIGKKINDKADDNGDTLLALFAFIAILTICVFILDYSADQTYDILDNIIPWLNQFSSLQLFFIFFLPLIILVPIFYLFSKPNHSNDTRFTIRLKKIKLNKLHRKLQKIEKNAQKLQNDIIKGEYKRNKLNEKKIKKAKASESKIEYKRNKLNEKKIKKAKALELKVEDKRNKLKAKEIEKTKVLESKIEELLFNFASKNNGIIMKSEIFDITKKYQKRDVLSTIEKLKEESLIESNDNSYMFLNLI